MSVEDNTTPEKNYKGPDDKVGCIVALIFLWIIFSIVKWGWGIHWLFGLLLLLFLLG
jgi:hypothetical protein